MAQQYTHLKEINEFHGVDLRSSDVIRQRGFASSGTKNVIPSPEGGLTHRWGSKLIEQGYGKCGLAKFVAKNEIVGFGTLDADTSAVPYALKKYAFTVTNSHSTASAVISSYYDPDASEFVFTGSVGGVVQVSLNLGDGTEVSPVTLADLATAFAGAADLGMSAPDIGTAPAAFMEIAEDRVLAPGESLEVSYWAWTAIRSSRYLIFFEDVDTTNDEITLFTKTDLEDESPYGSHGLKDGDVVFAAAIEGTLPGGISAATPYYIVQSTFETVKLSLTAGGAAINISSTGSGIGYFYNTQNPCCRLSNSALELGSDSFRNISTAELGGVLFMSPGLHSKQVVAGGTTSATARISKYDGNTHYTAGVPLGSNSESISNAGGAGSYTDSLRGVITLPAPSFAFTDQVYKFGLKQVDAAGNIVEGDLPETVLASLPSGSTTIRRVSPKQFFGDLPNILGLNNAFALTSASATSLTCSVNGIVDELPHGFEVGDIGFFWDESQGRAIQRKITAATSTSLTFSADSLDIDPTSPTYDKGGIPTFNQFAPITRNLRIVVWRTKGSDQTRFFLHSELPWNNTVTLYDMASDDELGAEYLPPTYTRSMPPCGRYLATFNDQLIVTGDELAKNTVYWSDLGSPEYFPETHASDLPAEVIGVRQTGEVLAAGTKNEIHTFIGDLANLNFKLERTAANVGFMSHASLQEIDEGILIFNSNKGPYVMYAGRKVEPLGMVQAKDGSQASRIDSFFTTRYRPDVEKPVFERAVAAVLPNEQLYLLFVPFEDPLRPGFATANCVTWVFDYSRGSWWPWYGWNAAGGMAQLGSQLYFTSRIHDGNAGATIANALSWTHQQQRDKGVYNYADHTNFIDFCWRGHWETLGQPGIEKRFIRCRIIRTETPIAPSCQIGLKTYLDLDSTALSNDDVITAGTEKSIKAKIKAPACLAMQIAFDSQRYYEPALISGFEIEAVASFRPEFKR